MPAVKPVRAIEMDTNFRKNLRIARIDQDISKGRMAKKIGIHVNTLNTYENNPENVTVGTLRKICKLGYLTPDQVLDLLFERTKE